MSGPRKVTVTLKIEMPSYNVTEVMSKDAPLLIERAQEGSEGRKPVVKSITVSR